MNTWEETTDWRDINLLNERREVEELLKGKRFNSRHVYRSCLLLAKYFLEQGVSQYDCVGEIYKWASKNNVNITENIVSVVNRVYRDDLKLQNKSVKIYKSDIDQINKYAMYFPEYQSKNKFYNLRLVMFSMLTYHRAYSDNKGICPISMTAISNWVRIKKNNLHNRYLKEIYNSGFIEKIEEDNSFMHLQSLKRKNKINHAVNKFKLNISDPNVENEFVIFEDKNLIEEFDKINNFFIK